MPVKKPFANALLEFIAAHPGEIATLTSEQLAEQTGYLLSQASEYYHGIAEEKQRLNVQAEEARLKDDLSEVVTYISSSQNVRVLYYARLGEVQIKSVYKRARVYPYARDEDDDNLYVSRNAKESPLPMLLSPQDSIEVGIYLLGLQPHIRDVQARRAAAPKIKEIEVSESYIPSLTHPDRVRLVDFASSHGISGTEAVKLFNKHLIEGAREEDWGRRSVNDVVIYTQGKRDAWEQLQHLRGFHACPDCPHELPEDYEEPPSNVQSKAE